MKFEGDLYIVYRKNPQYSELGYNEVLVCAKNENQAKGIAMAKHSSIWQDYCGESKKDILVRKVEKVLVGDVLLAG